MSVEPLTYFRDKAGLVQTAHYAAWLSSHRFLGGNPFAIQAFIVESIKVGRLHCFDSQSQPYNESIGITLPPAVKYLSLASTTSNEESVIGK
jgi:hypothetical protein